MSTLEKPKDYDVVIDALWETYKPRIDVVLTQIEAFIQDVIGWQFSSGIYDMTDEEYDHRFFIAPDNTNAGRERGIDCSITLGEAIVFGDGGVDGPQPYGVSFRFDMVGYGGRIVGQFAPYNYTEQCWVDGRDAEAVEERWMLVENVDFQHVPDLIHNYLQSLAEVGP